MFVRARGRLALARNFRRRPAARRQAGASALRIAGKVRGAI